MAKRSGKKSADSLFKAFSNTNWQSLLLTGIVVFILVFVLDYVVHGILLKDLYVKFARLFLPMAMMNARMSYMLGGQALFALLLVFIYSQGYTGKKSVMEGIRYGIYVGLLLQLPKSLMAFATAVYPGTLLIWWGVAGLIQTIVYGAVIGAMYKK